MYLFPQLQGTLYTTPAFLRGGSTSLTLVSCCLSVGIVVNTVLMLNFWHTLLTSSLKPETYCKQIVYFNDSFSTLAPLGLCVDLMMCAGYSLVFRTSLVCFSSFLMLSPITTVLARLNRNVATPLLIKEAFALCWLKNRTC